MLDVHLLRESPMTSLSSLPRTKIVCTLGPASRDAATVERLIDAGVSVFRLNMSHGSCEEHGLALANVRAASQKLGRPVAVLQDLCGPKIRVGDLPPDGLTVPDGGALVLVPLSSSAKEHGQREASELQNPTSKIQNQVSISYPQLAEDVRPGDKVFIDDGAIRLVVESVSEGAVACRVSTGGTIRARKGVNLPGVRLSTPAATEKDLRDLEWGLAQDVDYVALSFVRTVEDLRRVQRIVHARRADLPIIAKIEKPEALEHIDRIIDVADGLMVARGDLGVEMPLDQVPLIQKDLIDRCHAAHKPVIVATQMLESMTASPAPTRAEVSDVANAVFDGADAVMLSGETAVGRYPVNAVLMMARIATTAERFLIARRCLARPMVPSKAYPVADAVCDGAARIAADLAAALLVVVTRSGTTALLLSKNRPTAPILALSDRPRTVNRLALFWGVLPRFCETVTEFDPLLATAEGFALDQGLLRPGQTIVLVGGTRLGRSGATDMLRVHHVKEGAGTRGRGPGKAESKTQAPLPDGGGRAASAGEHAIPPSKTQDPPFRIASPDSFATHLVDQDRCIQCGVCVQRCPMDVYRLADGRVEVDPAAARHCLLDFTCADSCPTAAIAIRRP
jgi:pyruvate kinase